MLTLDLLLSKLDVRGPDECWPFMGCTDDCGYGLVKDGGRVERSHRVSFRLHGGALEPGQIVRHSCDNPPCGNPSHLLAGTRLDNMVDRSERGRTARGERNGRAKLAPSDVLFIRKSGANPKDLASSFGVTAPVIYNILARRIWRHLP